MWSAAENWSREAATFVIFVLLARLLGPSAIGLASLAMAAPLLMVIPVTQGIPDALVQRRTLDKLHLDSAFWFLCALGALLTAGVWLLAPLVALAFGEPLLADMVRWTSVVVVVRAVASVPSAILRRGLQFRLFTLRTMTGTVAGGVIGVGLALGGFGVWSLVAMFVSRSLVETVFLVIASGWRPRLRFSYGTVKELFGFAGPMVVQSGMRILNEELPKLALGTFLSPSAVGVYALARKPVELLGAVLIRPISAVALPAVARIQDDPARIDRFFDLGVRLAALIGLPMFMGFAAVAPTIIPSVLGPEWVGAIVATQVLMLLGVQRTIDNFCGHIILALGHSRLLLWLHITYTVIGAVFFTLGAMVSLETTVVAIVAANFVLLPVLLYKVRRLARIDVLRPLRMFPRLILATALMYVSVVLWQQAALTQLSPLAAGASSVVVGFLVYTAAVAALLRGDLLAAREILHKLRVPAGRVQGPAE
jgi:O-antigen/teichoic acid export membrane protein